VTNQTRIPRPLILAVFALVWAGGCGHAAKCIALSGQVVEFRGRLDTVARFGKPGFGEDTLKDERLSIPMLQLGSPVVVCGGAHGDSALSLRRIQLRFPDSSLAGAAGRQVVVRGALWPQGTGYDYTPAVIELKSIKLDTVRR
jgi:hypothetical protein